MKHNVFGSLTKYFYYYLQTLNPFYGFILGLSGTGKTNIASYISFYTWTIKKNYNVYYVNFNDIEQLESYEFPSKPSIVIFDDFSFMCLHNNKACLEFANRFVKARHKTKELISFFIVHYIHSIAPVLRNSHMRIVTSITAEYEIKQLRNYFNLNLLWDFYETYVYNPKPGLALVNLMGLHKKMRFPLSGSYNCLQTKREYQKNITSCFKKLL